jgi:putative ABC transport system permease protein
VLLFTLAVSLVTGVIFGAGPALHVARTDLMALLKQGSSRGTRAWGARNALVVAQVALSLVLLVGATLLGRSLQQLNAVPLGFSTRNALLASIDLEAASYDATRGRLLVQQLLDRLRVLPGVVDASVATTINPSPGGTNYSGVTPEGYTGRIEDVSFDVNIVDERYFQTMGIELVRGRIFNDRDRPIEDPLALGNVAIINEEAARRYFPGTEAIGKRIWIDSVGGHAWTVIGIARDTKLRGLRENREANLWRPLSQSFRPALNLILHTRGEPTRFAEVLRTELRALDPAVPLSDVHTLEQHIGYASAQERMATRLAAGFSLLALALAAIGLYGLLAYFVTQRTREIGVRIALGAERGDVLRHVLLRGLGLVAVGLGIGLPASLWISRLLGSMLFGVSANDPGSLALAATVLTAAGTLAVLLPARRATAVDPMVALRAE